MKIEKKIQLKNMEFNKEVVDRLVDENLSGKLDTYLQKFKGNDKEWQVSLTVETNKTGRFNGTLNILLDGKVFHYAREDYKKLEDLVNHLFDHLKQGLADA